MSKLGENEKINYKLVLEYLNKYGGTRHIREERARTEEEKKRSREETKNAHNVQEELNKMAELCKKKFNLDDFNVMQWQNSGNIPDYLWAQLKYSKHEKSPISISIFVEKDENNHARFRFSLEFKIKGSKEKDLEKYHRHLDKTISDDSSLIYFWGGHALNEDIATIKSKINNGKYDKVEISRIVDCNDEITNNDIEEAMLDGIQKLIPYYEYVLGINDLTEEYKSSNEFDKNIILYGPPGTGKTYNTVNYAVAIIEERDIEEVKNEDYKEILKRYNSYKKDEERIEFITFHQSYGYEEFIQGIKPEVKNGQVVYEVESGIFKEFCENCEKAEGKDEPYVFIIDEINRGNISKIFGELITLIEEDKRTDKNDKNVGLRVKLPYMKENEKPFGVPNNVYIIGTMNTADKSIALMDTALRRRFHFIEMMPDSKVLDKIIIRKDGKELDIAKMLDVMNKRIECLYDREHTIGHGYFTSLKNDNSINELGNIFEKKIIPLLQEYFYEDYSKIMLVLGDDGKKDEYKFIKKTEIKQSLFRGNISMDDIPEYSYEVNKEAFKNIESYIGIIGEENKDKNESEKEEE